MTQAVPVEKFLGPAIHRHARGEVVLHEGTFGIDLLVPPHVHATSVISLMLGGIAVEEVGHKSKDVTSQELVLTPAYVLHAYKFRKAGRWFNMELSDNWLARATEGAIPSIPVSQIVASDSAAAWATRVRTEVRQHDAVSPLAIDGALILMIAEISRLRFDSAKVRPRWLRGVEEAIDASVASPPSVEALAAMAGVHPGHLLRTFRRYHGATIANYVRQRRIEKARTEVALAQRPLSMIALDAGFSDQSHFTRTFRKAFGQTPGQYARALRGR